jgi:hypothetical protein
MLRLFLCITLFTLFTFPSLSKAYYSRRCREDHSKVSMKTHAQKFVEDLSAPRAQRVKALICLSFYGKAGVPILSKVLERELNNPDSTLYALKALGYIQDRSVIAPILRFVENVRLLENKSQSREHSGSSSPSRFDSIKPKRYYKSREHLATETLVKLAFTALEEPNPVVTVAEIKPEAIFPTKFFSTKFQGGIVVIPPRRLSSGESIVIGESHFNSKGVKPTRSDVNKIVKFLQKIKENEKAYTTEEGKLVVQAASRGLERIEKRMALLKKYGPKSNKKPKSEPKQKREAGKPHSLYMIDSDGNKVKFSFQEIPKQ